MVWRETGNVTREKKREGKMTRVGSFLYGLHLVVLVRQERRVRYPTQPLRYRSHKISGTITEKSSSPVFRQRRNQ